MDSLIDYIIELQALAQAGLYYSKDAYDIERFQRIRDITTEMMSMKSGLSIDVVKDLFCCEKGYQTPKIDTRAAIFKDGKILLVREKTANAWAMPGGWLDVNESVKTGVIRETKEEAGLDVETVRLIAVQDRNKHNIPKYAYGICKIFVLCKICGGKFKPNIEISESSFFNVEDLPNLSAARNTEEQIRMCFKAYHNENWVVQFD